MGIIPSSVTFQNSSIYCNERNSKSPTETDNATLIWRLPHPSSLVPIMWLDLLSTHRTRSLPHLVYHSSPEEDLYKISILTVQNVYVTYTQYSFHSLNFYGGFTNRTRSPLSTTEFNSTTSNVLFHWTLLFSPRVKTDTNLILRTMHTYVNYTVHCLYTKTFSVKTCSSDLTNKFNKK